MRRVAAPSLLYVAATYAYTLVIFQRAIEYRHADVDAFRQRHAAAMLLSYT